MSTVRMACGMIGWSSSSYLSTGYIFACLGVTFEEFLWDVFARSEHVDGVVAEVGDGS